MAASRRHHEPAPSLAFRDILADDIDAGAGASKPPLVESSLSRQKSGGSRHRALDAGRGVRLGRRRRASRISAQKAGAASTREDRCAVDARLCADGGARSTSWLRDFVGRRTSVCRPGDIDVTDGLLDKAIDNLFYTKITTATR